MFHSFIAAIEKAQGLNCPVQHKLCPFKVFDDWPQPIPEVLSVK